MARVRLISYPFPSGGKLTYNGNVTTQSFTSSPSGPIGSTLWAQCSDSTGKASDHNMNITKHVRIVDPLSGQSGGSGTYEKYIPGYYAAVNIGHSGAGMPNETTLRTQAIARTNPSRPTVSLPVFIGELRDLPQLVKLAGDTIIKKAAGANLAYQFGWKPLISDVAKLLNFQNHVDKRARELERLYSNKGLKRRIELYDAQRTSKASVVIESAGGAILFATRESTAKEKAWATIRWLPTSLPRVIDDQYIRSQAAKAAFGLHGVSAADAWNLIPWSWLADWFGNIGDYLAANHNSVPASHGSLNLMRYYETKHVFTRVTGVHPDIKGGNAEFLYSAKTRVVGGGPGISANLPFLSGRQLSILGSLAALRRR